MTSLDHAKASAAALAIRDYFGEILQLKYGAIGIGSGSTIRFVVDEIKNLALSSRPDLLNCLYVPTSFQSKMLIIDAGLPLSDLDQSPMLDVAFDGADEVDPRLNCIKGGGGAHLQEKIVASSADRFVIVADFNKDSSQLGTKWRKGVPIEVLPMAYKNVCRSLRAISCNDPVLRMALNKAGPVITDSGNFIIDANFGPIDDAVILNQQIKNIPGVFESGLFLGMVSRAYFGQDDRSVSVRDRKALVPQKHNDSISQLNSGGILTFLANQY